MRVYRRGPFGNPYGGGPFGSQYGYGGYRGYRPYRPAGGGCLRDACLIESGCCLAEALDGNCLLLLLVTVAQWGAGLGTGHRGSDSSRRPVDLLVGAIRTYQREISPRRRPCCRFTPTCSEYAARSLTTYGLRRGGWLAARRLLRCRPGGRRGPDPIPQELT